MLDEVRDSSTARFREVFYFIKMIEKLEEEGDGKVISVELRAAKGLFFVHLYGAYEYSIKEAFKCAVAYINSNPCELLECAPSFLSLALDPECKAIASVGQRKVWGKRLLLFNKVFSSEKVYIRDDVFPGENGNLKYDQLKQIWLSLCANSPLLPEPNIGGVINEIVENRNAISHGRESPAVVGGRNTIKDLREKYDAIYKACMYLIGALDEYLASGEYAIRA